MVLQKPRFHNTFHRFDMYFEQIVWRIDEPLFQFLPINFQGRGYFESMDFYTYDKSESIRMGKK